jgi:hypothetical protein
VPDLVVSSPAADVTYVSLPPAEPAFASKSTPKPRKSAPEPSPQQIIVEAQKDARVAPTKRGYFGGRGVQRYLWSPGKIYDVYVTPAHQTRLELPPGETLGHALVLNPRSFDVLSATVDTEQAAHSIIFIRPCAAGEGENEMRCLPSPNVDVALTSASGRSYDVHLIVGTVGMVGVTWEIVPLALMQGEESGLLPKRQP